MILVNSGSNHNSLIIFFILPLPFARPFLPHSFGPPHGIFVWWDFLVRHVRMY
jgi:hypothetical protein